VGSGYGKKSSKKCGEEIGGKSKGRQEGHDKKIMTGKTAWGTWKLY